MPKICYVEKRFGPASLNLIDKANVILDEYKAQGFDLTLRQLYYQFVARGFLENTTQSYKRLGGIIDDARLAGLIDWKRIEDRTRHSNTRPSWEAPSDILTSCHQSFHMDRWQNQKHRVEVWVEKEALAGVFASACHTLDIPWFACRGYVSQSEMWRAAQRMLVYQKSGQIPVILHFGDHDPSGIDMTRDIGDRMKMFGIRGSFEIRRLALNMAQVSEFNPPPNPAKETDSRFAGYTQLYGEESWELDALQPKYLIDLVGKTVDEYRDMGKWREIADQEQDHRARLQVLAEHWDSFKTFMDKEHDEDLTEATHGMDGEYLKELGDGFDTDSEGGDGR